MEIVVRTPAILEARGVCMLSSVASAMAKNSAMAGSSSLHQPTFKGLASRYTEWLVDEARTGQLILCDSAGVPCTWSDLIAIGVASDVDAQTNNHWVTIHHLNSWGATHGHHFTTTSENVPWFDERGQLGGTFTGNIDVQEQDGRVKQLRPTSPMLDEHDKPRLQGPTPLTSAQIAECFHGLARNDAEDWKRILANKPTWLLPSNISRGTQGGPGATWNPVLFGAELIRRKEVRKSTIRSRFQTLPLLRSWLEQWEEYEDSYFSTDS